MTPERNRTQDVLFLLLILFLPFVAVGYKKGVNHRDFWINLLLTFLVSPVGAILHALYLLVYIPRDNSNGYRELDCEETVETCCPQCTDSSSQSCVRQCELSRCVDCDSKAANSHCAQCNGTTVTSTAPAAPAVSQVAPVAGPSVDPPSYDESEVVPVMDNKVQSS